MEFIKCSQPIKSVSHMVEIAMGLQEQGRSIYFRGQEYEEMYRDEKREEKCRELHLIPSIGRECKFIGEKKNLDLMSERNLLHRFRRYARIESKRVLGEWEALFFARHHGLPTRLLDWTANPLFALFCATQCEEPKTDAAVWAIVKKKEDEDERKDIDLLSEEDKSKAGIKDDPLYYHSLGCLPVNEDKKRGLKEIEELQKPLRLKGVRILYPFYVDPRMIAQHSFFTIQDDPWTPLEDYHKNDGYLDKNKDNIDIERIIRWKVPKKNRLEIVKQLERLAIDNRTMYPDLDGLAKGLWQLEILRQQKQ